MYEAIFFFIWLLAGFISGVSGLGAAMFAVPLVSVFVDLHTLIPVANCLVAVLCFEMGYIYRKDILLTELKNMIIGSVPGLFLGAYILLLIPTAVLLFCIGILLTVFVLWQFLRKMPEKAGTSSPAKAMFAGFISGILATSASFGGPPNAVYSLYLRWNQRQTLATLNAFGFLVSLLGVCTYIFTGFLTYDVFFWTMLGIPAVSLGILLSLPVVRYINIYLFRIILLIVIGLSGIGCIIKAVL